MYVNNHFANFTHDLPILVLRFELGEISFGNSLGNIIEGMSCAQDAGLHVVGFYGGRWEGIGSPRGSENEVYINAMPSLRLHEKPASNHNEGIERVKSLCKSNIFPWESQEVNMYSNIPMLRQVILEMSSNFDKFDKAAASKSGRPKNEFDHVTLPRINSTNEKNSNFFLPDTPTAAILFRCTDILHHQREWSAYGINNFNVYPMIIPNSATSIYILTEPVSYGGSGVQCQHLSTTLIEFLASRYPRALVAIRRGHLTKNFAILTKAAYVVCPPSTFCFFPAAANAEGRSYFSSSVLLARAKPIYIHDTFHWLSYPPPLTFGHVDLDAPDALANITASLISNDPILPPYERGRR
jgi:hypothetical protein